MAERRVKVAIKVGLHARPAEKFVKTAAKSSAEVTVSRPDGGTADAKSILLVLGLDVEPGEEVIVASTDEAMLDILAEQLATPWSGEAEPDDTA